VDTDTLIAQQQFLAHTFDGSSSWVLINEDENLEQERFCGLLLEDGEENYQP
jgi:hypothetical protein